MLSVEMITLYVVSFLAVAAVVRGIQSYKLYVYLKEMQNKAYQHKKLVDTIKKNAYNAKLRGIAKKEDKAMQKSKKTDVVIKTG
jgi:hypothetical protein